MSILPGKNIFGNSKKMFKIIFLIFAAFAMLFVFMLGFVFYGLYQIYIPLSNGQSQAVEIEKGQGVKKIAASLEDYKLIRSSFWFEVYIWLNDSQEKLQAGEYEIGSDLSVAQIAQAIIQGKIKTDEAWVTIPEGFTLKEIEDRLLANGLSQAAGLKEKTIGDFKQQYQTLSDVPDGKSLEGFLFPDTYKFKKEVSQEEILRKMLDNFEKKLTWQMREDIKNEERSIFEIITMASLIEKEVKTEQDRKIVSGIFWKRVKENYPLESDATLSYILGDKKDRHSAEETKVDSPYNTYLYKGLPPGPICNPGLEAIEAAIYPEQSDYYYFLTKPDTGEAVFAKTFQEQIANKAKYLK